MTLVEPPKILVVDDETAIRNLLIDLLGDEGYAVVAASNGRAALAIAQQQRPDLILMDVMMPELDGLETLQHIRALPGSRDVPIILMSAAHRLSPEISDTVEFITKPFNLDHVLAVVARMLASADDT